MNQHPIQSIGINSGEEKWLSMAEASLGTPYSAEYLSLLARKGKLAAKKIDNVWYTTKSGLDAYMQRQMFRAQIQNGNAPVSNAVLPVSAPVAQPVIEKAVPAPSQSPAFSAKPLKTIRSYKDDHEAYQDKLKQMAESRMTHVVQPVVEAEIPMPVFEMKPLKTIRAYKHDHENHEQKLQLKINKTIAPNVEHHMQPSHVALIESALERALARHKPAFRLPSLKTDFKKNFSKSATALALVSVLFFTLFPVPFVFSFFDKALSAAKEAINDANTVMGFRPGTHKNEILLLDKEGNISIMGHVATEGQLISSVPNGTAPIVVDSMTTVTNLSADLLDGVSAHEFTLAFVTKNGNVTTENVYLEGEVGVGKTLSVRGSTKLMGEELTVLGDAEFAKILKVVGPAYFDALVAIQGNLTVGKNISAKGSITSGSSVIGKKGSFDEFSAGEVSAGRISSPFAEIIELIAEDISVGALTGNSAELDELASASSTLSTLTFSTATGTSATTTNLFATNAVFDNLFSSNQTITNVTINNQIVTNLDFTNATGTNSTTTNLYVSGIASATDLRANTGIIGFLSSVFGSFTNLLVNSSSTLQDFTFQNATGTSATTTNLYVSGRASTTDLRSNTGFIGNLTSTLGTLTSLLVNGSSTLQNFSGQIGTLGNLVATGSTTLQNFTFQHATGTSATTTTFFSNNVTAQNMFLATTTSSDTVAAYSFVGNTDTGFGRTGSGFYGFIVDGVRAMEFKTSGTDRGVGLANGSASTPSLSWIANSATGFYRVADNEIGFSVSGSGKWQWDTSGNFKTMGSGPSLGIGTTSPYAKISIVGGSSGTVAAIDALSGFTGLLLDLKTASSTKLSVNQSGDLFVSGSTTLQNFTFRNATGTSATTTNFFSTISSAGTFYADSGAFGSPSYTFSTDTNTGMYRSNPDSLSLAAGGLNLINLTTSQIEFRPSGSTEWTMDSTGLLAGTDNTNDIGASGASRPRTGYFGTSVVTPLLSSTNILATGSTTLQNFTFQHATGTSATTTYFFSSTASTTNLFAGTVRAGDGSASAPSLSFANQSNSGFYRNGTAVDVAVNGTATFRFGNGLNRILQGGLQNTDGSAVTPAYSFTNADTGLYNAGSGNLGISVNGVEAARWTSTGLGLGTTTPFERLSVAGNFYLGGNLTATGTASIAGAANLLSTLFVNSSTTLQNFSAQTATLRNLLVTGSSTLQAFTSSSSTIGTLLSNNATSTNLFVSALASTTSLRANTAYFGNVGIGTSSPTSLLHVGAGTTGNNQSWLTLDSGSGTGIPAVFFNRNSNNKALISVAFGADSGIGGSVADDLIVRSNQRILLHANGSAGTAHMVIQNSGNVGIGSTTPAQLLSVAGNTYITGGLGVGQANTTAGTLETSGSAGIGTNLFVRGLLNCSSAASTVQTDGSGKLVCGTVTAIGGTSAGGWTWVTPNVVQLATTTDQVVIGTASSSPYAKLFVSSGGVGTTTLALAPVSSQTANIIDIYDTSGALSSVLTSSGRLGLGVTSPGAPLSIGGTASAFAVNALSFDYNSGTTRIAAGSAAGNSSLSLLTTASGAVSERVRITAAGNVGIGTTTPEYKFEVYDSTNGAGENKVARFTSSGRTIVDITATAEHAFLNIDSAHSNTYLPVISLKRQGVSYGTVGLDRASNGYTESQMVVGTVTTVPLSFKTNGSERVHITSDGNVGIGTTSPISTLDVFKSSDGSQSDGLYLTNGFTTADSGNSINFADTSSQKRSAVIAGAWSTSGTTDGYLRFLTRGSDALSEAMRIISSGNIGIATTSPFEKLSVAGNAYIGGNLTATGTASIAGATSLLSTLFVNSSTTLQAMTSSSSTIGILLSNRATTTDLYVSGLASTTNVRSNVGVIGNLTSTFGTLGNLLVTGSSTLQAFSGTTATLGNLLVNGSSTLQAFTGTNYLALGSTTLQNFSGQTGSLRNLFVSGSSTLQAFTGTNYLALGSTTLQAFTATQGTITSATSTNLYATNFLATGSTTLQAYRGTSGTTTNLYGGNLLMSGSTTLQAFSGTNYVALGSTTLQNFTAFNATTSNATTTSLYVSGLASTTELRSNTATIGSLTAGPITSGLINGQTISSAANFTGTLTATGGLTTLSNLLLTGSSTLQNFSAQNGTLGNLLVNGSSTLQNFTASNSTTTSATTTNLFATNAVFTNLYGTALGFTDLIFTSATGTNATTTNLYVSGLASTTNLRANTGIFGNIGIGTTTPKQKLHIDEDGGAIIGLSNPDTTIVAGDLLGKIEFSGMDNFFAGVYSPLASIRAIAPSTIAGSGTAQSALSFFTSAANAEVERMRIDEDGNIGIGTTTPETQLHVFGTGTGTTLGQLDTNLRLQTNTGTVGAGSEISFRGSSSTSTTAAIYASIAAPVTSNGANGSVGYFSFATKAAATDLTLTERLRIAANGNVGVGTTTPSYKLSVSGSALFDGGTIYASSLTATSSITTALLTSTNLLVTGSSTLQNFSGQTGTLRNLLVTGSSTLQAFTGTNYLALGSTTLQAMTSSSSTIGILLSNRATTTDLFVSGLASTTNLRANTGIFGNIGIGTTTPWGTLAITNTTNNHSFIVEDSASIDTSPFVIDNSGNVGIGTSTPVHKLHVDGSILTSGALYVTDNTNGFQPLINRYGTYSFGYNTYINPGNELVVASGDAGVTLAGTSHTTGALGEVLHLASDQDIRFWTNIQNATTSASSTPRAIITTAGNFGIGTISPNFLLEVNGTASTTNLFATNSTTTAATTTNFFSTTGTITNLFSTNQTITSVTVVEQTVTNLNFQNATGTNATTSNLYVSGLASTSQLRADTALFGGYVGINNTNPGTHLDVTGNIKVSGSSGSYMIGRRDTSATAWQLYSQAGNFSIYDTANTVDRFTILPSSGNVGIGTTTPDSLLVVSSGTSGDSVLTIEADTDNSNENDNPTLRLRQDGALVSGALGLSGATTLFTGMVTNSLYLEAETANPIQFVTDDVARMTIDENGNVGIATSSPSYKLSVSGSAFFDGGTVYTSSLVATSSVTTALLNSANLSLTGSSTLQAFTGTNYLALGSTTLQNFSAQTGSLRNLLMNGSSTLQNFTSKDHLALGSTTLQAMTSSSSTIGTLLSNNATSTNLHVSGRASTTEIRANTGIIGSLTTILGTLSNLLVTGSTTLQNFTAQNSTTTSATSTNLFATNASTTNLKANTAIFGNVAIGTTTATSRLTVAGDIVSYATSPALIGSVTESNLRLDGAENVSVQGGYAYIGTTGIADGITVVDITNPADPTIVASTTSGLLGGDTSDIIVNGKYAYVAITAADRLSIVDISDSSNMVVVGTYTDSAGAGSIDGIESIYLSGSYIYATSLTDDTITIIDVTDPTNPIAAGSIAPGVNDLDAPIDIMVQNGFAYVTASSSVQSFITVFDVSNPADPKFLASTTPTANLATARGLYVSGRYLYATGSSGDAVEIYDISNPRIPALVGSVADATNLNGAHTIQVRGRYAYVGANVNDSVTVLDVSDPATPFVVGSYADSAGAGSLDGVGKIVVAGRYIYAASITDDTFTILNVGSDIPNLTTGDLASQYLRVSDTARIGADLQVGGGFSLAGGLSTYGGLSSYFSSTSTTAGSTIGANLIVESLGIVTTGTDTTYGVFASTTRFGATGGTINTYGGYFNVTGDTGGTSQAVGLYASASGADNNYAAIFANGNVGIGTTTPSAQLSVTNTGNLHSFIVEDSTSPDTSPFIIDNAGNVGVGTTTLAQKLNVSGNILHTGNMVSTAGGTQSTWMTFKEDANGNSLVLGSGGATVLGSGESASQFNSNIATSVETLYLASDQDMLFSVGAQNGYASRIDAMKITNTGLVGIGTTTPWGQLSASSTSVFPTLAIEQKGAGAAATFLGGNVGIGTINPNFSLEVNGTASTTNLFATNSTTTSATSTNFFSTTGTFTNLYSTNQTITNVTVVDQTVTNLTFTNATGTSATTTNLYVSGSASTSNFRANTGLFGNVGIGTTTPQWKLQVSGTGPQLTLSDSSALASNHWSFRNSSGMLYISTSSPTALATTSSISLLTLDGSTGRMGVNLSTTTPRASLHVGGALRVEGGNYNDYADALTDAGIVMASNRYLYSSFSNNNARRLIGNDGSGNIDIGQAGTALIPSINLRAGNAGYIALIPGGGEAMRLTSAGNVGIGTTTPNQKLSIFNNGADAAIEFSTLSGPNESWTIGIDDSDGSKFKIASSSALGTSDRFVIDGNGIVSMGNLLVTGSSTLQNFSGQTGTLRNLLMNGSSTLQAFTGTNYLALGSTTLQAMTSSSSTIGILLSNRATTTDLFVSGLASTTNLRANISSFGTVGIGTTTPSAVLAVTNNSNYHSLIVEDSSSTDSTPFVITNAGDVGIGTNAPTSKLHVVGNLNVVGISTTTSAHIANNFKASSDGSAGTPAYSFTNDPGMGFYRIADNRLGMVPGDSLVATEFEIVSGGSDRRRLKMYGEGNTDAIPHLTHNNDTTTGIRFIPGAATSLSKISLNVDSAPVLTVTDGNVGIGTTTPNARLEVDSDQSTGASIANGLRVMETTGGYGVNMGAGSNYGWIQGLRGFSSTQSSNTLALNPIGGNVGIGTTSPNARLTVTADGTLATSSQVTISGASDSRMQLVYGYDTMNNFGHISAVHQTVAFTNLILNGFGGKVAIGTTTPQQMLSVVNSSGSIIQTKSVTTSDAGVYIDAASDSTANIRLQKDGADKWFIAGGQGTNNDFSIATSKNGASGAMFTINSSGYVMIGTTTPSVGAMAVAGAVVSRSLTTINNNFIVDRPGTSGYASFLVRNNGADAWSFGVRAGQTYAGIYDEAAGVQRLVADTSGNVAVSSLAAATGNHVCYDSTIISSMHTFSTCSSLRELKSDIASLSLGLETLMQLNPSSFTDKRSGEQRFGFIAEEVNAVNPILSTFYQGELRGVDYDGLTSLTIKSLQELNLKVGSTTIALASLATAFDEQALEIDQMRLDIAELKDTASSTELRLASIEGLMSSTTVFNISTSTPGFLASVLEAVGATVADGWTSFRQVAIESLSTYALTVGKSEKPAGITVYDEDTGEPYCLKIKSGQQVSAPGACGSESVSSAPAPSSGGSTGSSSPAPETESASSTPAVVVETESSSSTPETVTETAGEPVASEPENEAVDEPAEETATEPTDDTIASTEPAPETTTP